MNPIAIVTLSFSLMIGTVYAAVTMNPNIQKESKNVQTSMPK